MAHGFTSFGPYPDELAPRRCLFCRVSISDESAPLYCPAHLSEYETRREQGVTSRDLDRRWRDTLELWRERPGALDDEPERRLFRFRQRVGSWVIFWRGYEKRLPDWIAVNTTTSEVCRLIETSSQEVTDHLEGIIPAPHQEELPSRWGRPESYHLVVKRFLRRSLTAQVNSAEFPVYGVSGDPFGIKLVSTRHSMSGSRTTRIGLVFAGPDSSTPEVIANFDSEFARRRAKLWPEDELDPIVRAVRALLRECGPFEMASTVHGPPEPLQRRFEIAEIEGEANIFRFPGTTNLYYLSSGDSLSRLSAVVWGVEEDELYGLLDCVTVVNERLDLLSQYQSELDETRDERRRYHG